jgi:phosphoserine phosphatase
MTKPPSNPEKPQYPLTHEGDILIVDSDNESLVQVEQILNENLRPTVSILKKTDTSDAFYTLEENCVSNRQKITLVFSGIRSAPFTENSEGGGIEFGSMVRDHIKCAPYVVAMSHPEEEVEIQIGGEQMERMQEEGFFQKHVLKSELKERLPEIVSDCRQYHEELKNLSQQSKLEAINAPPETPIQPADPQDLINNIKERLNYQGKHIYFLNTESKAVELMERIQKSKRKFSEVIVAFRKITNRNSENSRTMIRVHRLNNNGEFEEDVKLIPAILPFPLIQDAKEWSEARATEFLDRPLYEQSEMTPLPKLTEKDNPENFDIRNRLDKKRVTVFLQDFDGTMHKGNPEYPILSLEFFTWLNNRHFSELRTEKAKQSLTELMELKDEWKKEIDEQKKSGERSSKQYHQFIIKNDILTARALEGMSYERVRELWKNYNSEHPISNGIYPHTLTLNRFLRRCGIEPVIQTGAYDFMMPEICAASGTRYGNGARLEVIDGIFSGAMDGVDPNGIEPAKGHMGIGENKARMAAEIGRNALVIGGIGNRYSDQGLIMAALVPISTRTDVAGIGFGINLDRDSTQRLSETFAIQNRMGRFENIGSGLQAQEVTSKITTKLKTLFYPIFDYRQDPIEVNKMLEGFGYAKDRNELVSMLKKKGLDQQDAEIEAATMWPYHESVRDNLEFHKRIRDLLRDDPEAGGWGLSEKVVRNILSQSYPEDVVNAIMKANKWDNREVHVIREDSKEMGIRHDIVDGFCDELAAVQAERNSLRPEPNETGLRKRPSGSAAMAGIDATNESQTRQLIMQMRQANKMALAADEGEIVPEDFIQQMEGYFSILRAKKEAEKLNEAKKRRSSHPPLPSSQRGSWEFPDSQTQRSMQTPGIPQEAIPVSGGGIRLDNTPSWNESDEDE